MAMGSIAIANDLLGFIVSEDGDTCRMKSKDGAIHTVNTSVVTEVVTAQALSALFYEKLRKYVSDEKNKNQ